MSLQLLKDREDGERELEADLREAIQLIPYRASLHDTSLSGKHRTSTYIEHVRSADSSCGRENDGARATSSLTL